MGVFPFFLLERGSLHKENGNIHNKEKRAEKERFPFYFPFVCESATGILKRIESGHFKKKTEMHNCIERHA